MIKNLLMTMVSLGVVAIFSGCGDSAVECDDSDAKKLVMEITEDTTKKQIILKRLVTMDLTYSKILVVDPRVFDLGFQEIKKSFLEKNPELIESFDMVSKEYADANPQLISIRTNAQDDKLKKTECAAQISLAYGNSIDITYDLSITSDGELYVEVGGL